MLKGAGRWHAVWAAATSLGGGWGRRLEGPSLHPLASGDLRAAGGVSPGRWELPPGEDGEGFVLPQELWAPRGTATEAALPLVGLIGLSNRKGKVAGPNAEKPGRCQVEQFGFTLLLVLYLKIACFVLCNEFYFNQQDAR